MPRACYKRASRGRYAVATGAGARAHSPRGRPRVTPSSDGMCPPLLLPSPITCTLRNTPAQLFINEAGIYKERQLAEAPELNHKTEGGNCNSSLQLFINIHH